MVTVGDVKSEVSAEQYQLLEWLEKRLAAVEAKAGSGWFSFFPPKRVDY